MKQGDRVTHIDGGTGKIQAYWVVWDAGQKGERTGYYCESVLRLREPPSPTIAAPSPSNEVNDEMVDAVIIGLGLEEDIGDALAREDVKRVLEVALKARKPADDGNEG